MTIADLKHFPSEVTRTLDLVLELKAHALVVIDLRGISTATDFFVLASGNSDVQVRAIAEHVVDKLKLQGARPGHVEGMQGGRWVLLDYINFVVHVFHPEARTFYQLEDLWGDAPRWDVSPES